ncbi:MAG: hypothetical protein ACOCYT_02430 [Chloroflexota bacterium]
MSGQTVPGMWYNPLTMRPDSQLKRCSLLSKDRGLSMLRNLFGRIFSRENVFAVALCIIIILLIIVTSDSAPQWIYEGF